MSKSNSLAIVLPESNPEQVEELLLSFASVEEVHLRLALVFQAAQGACLMRLREEHGHHNKARHSTACGVAWEDYIKSKFKFSDEKARRLMLVWQGMEKKLSKLSPGDKQRFLDFLRRPMILLPPAEVKILEKITEKITDADTQHEFLLECGFIKLPGEESITRALATKRKSPSRPEHGTPEGSAYDQLWLPIIGGGDGTLKTVWDPMDELVKSWNEQVKEGAIKQPRWQWFEEARKRAILDELETKREVYIKKIDSMISPLRESLGKGNK